jgi:hypothetical protein
MLIIYNICVECHGGSICIHNKLKIHCKFCGKNFCEHKKLRSRCIECGGSELCEHIILKKLCKICDGSKLCCHDKDKYHCKECHGGAYCLHNNNKRYCKECNGTALCEHNRVKTRCKECNGSRICRHGKYKGYCYMHLFPDKEYCRNHKTKEKSVADFILENFSNFTWICDKKVQDGCSKRRPDLLLDLGHQVIIVEVDENMHTDYDCTCENKRIMEISQDIGHRPIVMIRFNPDGYTNNEGEKINSPWTIHKGTHILHVKEKQRNIWNKRLECLKEQIEYWSNPKNKTEKTLEIVHLFYNGFNDGE